MARRADTPTDRKGTPTASFGDDITEGDYFIEYWSDHPTYIYRAEHGRLVRLPFSREEALGKESISRAIARVAADNGQHHGVIFEIRDGDIRQIGNVLGNGDTARVVWSPSRSKNAKFDADLRKRYEFFKTFGGGQVGHAAEGALALARAEKIAEDRGWEAEWEPEQEAWEDFLGDYDKIEDIDSVEFCMLKDDQGRVLASLGGITFSKKSSSAEDRNYRRYTEAELALEAAHTARLL